MSTTINWRGDDGMIRRMDEYGRQVERAVFRLAQYWAPVLEAFAKEYAPWTDRTSNARQTLRGFVDDLARDTVTLYLAHGMDYGLHLETRYAGRYAIIWPTIESHLEDIRESLQAMLAGRRL